MAKKRTRTAATVQAVSKADQVVQVPLEVISPHPDNPGRQRITKANTAELAADMADHGQLQPITLRPNGPEAYEIIYGERRFRAALLNKWATIAATVRQADNVTALTLQAAENGQRVDIDPISRAAHLAKLTAEQADGSMPLSQAEAGRLYGLTSQSAVSNLVRLLKLPADWQARIRNGELTSKQARALVPYAEAPEVLKIFAEDLADPYSAAEWRRGYDDLVERLRDIARDESRPMDRRTKHYYGYQVGEHPRYFEPTDAQREKLGVCQLPIGKPKKKGAAATLVEVATNATLWEQLNEKQVAAAIEGRKRIDKGKPPTLDSQERAAADRQAKAERQQKLRQILATFRERLLRAGLAEAIKPDWRLSAMVPYVVQRFAFRTRVDGPLAIALAEVTDTVSIKPLEDGAYGAKRAMQAAKVFDGLDASDDPVADTERLQAALVRLFVWPTSPKAAPAKHHGYFVSDPAPDWKTDLLSIPSETLADWCGWFQVTLAGQWKRAAVNGTAAREVFRQTLQQHTKAELLAIARAAKCPPDIACDSTTKAHLVTGILKAHTKAKPLKMPAGWAGRK